MARGVSGPQIPEYSCQHRQKAAKSEVFSPERLLLGHCHWNRKESVRRGRHPAVGAQSPRTLVSGFRYEVQLKLIFPVKQFARSRL